MEEPPPHTDSDAGPGAASYGSYEDYAMGPAGEDPQASDQNRRAARQASTSDPSGSASSGSASSGSASSDAPPAGPLPEEKVLLRLMLDQGTPMVEFILGNMSLDEFTEGVSRDMVQAFIEMYQEDAVKPSRITDGDFGDALQSLAASVMVDKYTPSENWRQRQNISVPRFNQEPYEAGASAMTLLKLDRVKEAIARQKETMYRASRTGEGNLGEMQQQLMQLFDLRKRIKQREFLDRE